MKIGLKLLATLFVAFLTVGCGSSGGDDNGGEPEGPTADGWMLAKTNGSQAGAGTVYLQLNSDNTFNLYQSINQMGYTKFTGTYSVTADSQGVQTMSGVYTGQKPWKDSYLIVKLDEHNMTLKSVQEALVYDYVSVQIPAHVKDGVTDGPTSRAEVEPFL